MSEITEALGHKIGPMPAGAWIALVAGGLGIAYYTRTHSSSAAVVDPGTQELDNTVTGTSAAAYTGAGAGDITTNDQWATKAVTYLISQGASGTVADGAVRNYLDGNTLTASQTALIDLVLAAFGPPPSAPPLPLSGVIGDTAHPAGSSGGTSTSTTPTAASVLSSLANTAGSFVSLPTGQMATFTPDQANTTWLSVGLPASQSAGAVSGSSMGNGVFSSGVTGSVNAKTGATSTDLFYGTPAKQLASAQAILKDVQIHYARGDVKANDVAAAQADVDALKRAYGL